MSLSNSSFFRIWEIMISWKITLSVFKFNIHCFFFLFLSELSDLVQDSHISMSMWLEDIKYLEEKLKTCPLLT